jgi:hypothetical protein
MYFGAHEMPEYKISGYLNNQGLDGWELVHLIRNMMITAPHIVANYTFIFKREKH